MHLVKAGVTRGDWDRDSIMETVAELRPKRIGEGGGVGGSDNLDKDDGGFGKNGR